MAKLTSKASKLISKSRKELKASTFGLPGSRKYPMPDASHAANAKARATQQVNKGNLSSSAAAKIDAKANRILGRSNPMTKAVAKARSQRGH